MMEIAIKRNEAIRIPLHNVLTYLMLDWD
uniref:Uncharacterized protein n=1 Tax=Arundo donax TaxID=35708 RepID=A0A0A9C8H0_ARUDO